MTPELDELVAVQKSVDDRLYALALENASRRCASFEDETGIAVEGSLGRSHFAVRSTFPYPIEKAPDYVAFEADLHRSIREILAHAVKDSFHPFSGRDQRVIDLATEDGAKIVFVDRGPESNDDPLYRPWIVLDEPEGTALHSARYSSRGAAAQAYCQDRGLSLDRDGPSIA